MLDTDELIEERAGTSVSEIFALEGEAAFREFERRAIERISRESGLVIAVGGGAVLDGRNVEALGRNGVIYYLGVTSDEVLRRAPVDGTRPLMPGDRAGVSELLEKRESAYMAGADVTINTTGRDVEDIASEILSDFNGRMTTADRRGTPESQGRDSRVKTEARVELGDRSYGILVGAGLLELLDGLVPSGRWNKAFVVTDSNVEPLYGERCRASLKRSGLTAGTSVIEAGERSKASETALRLVDEMLSFGLTRTDVVIALGGGVVGDVTGFAASVYKRGVDIVQVPTTLMSQVDSAIGGKTGVNLEAGKNLVGTFHQPVAVVADVGTLVTLPARDYTSGLAEVAKYSLISPSPWDEELTDWAPLLRDPKAATSEMVAAVSRCACAKAEVVSIDERDTGPRAVLNYGHTLGHALEACTGYEGVYSHGEAVSVGMVFAANVAERLGATRTGLVGRHRTLLRSLRLPVAPADPAPDFSDLLAAMAHDKKSSGDLTMVLIEGGQLVVRRGLDPGLMERCYDALVTTGR